MRPRPLPRTTRRRSRRPAATEPAKAAAAELPGTVEALFADYLHFARMGKFDAAELYAVALLNHADCKPDSMLALAEKYRNIRETLVVLIDGSSIRENAARILDYIRQGEVNKRKSAAQIADAITLLMGDPTQRSVGLERLQYAGEYAIPLILDCLRDAGKTALHPYIERACRRSAPRRSIPSSSRSACRKTPCGKR